MAECTTGTVVPTNNTPLECEEYKSTDCIQFEDAVTYLGLPAGSSLTVVFTALLASLVNARLRISNLENQ